MKKGSIAALAAVVLAGLAGAVPGATGSVGSERYIVVLAGVQGDQGFAATGTHAAAVAAVAAAGGTVANDLSKQIGVLVAESSVAGFATALSSSALVETVGQDKKFKGLPDSGPEQTADPVESLQWDMEMIRAPQAHNFQAGSRAVDVGILDSGIDGRHPDFLVDGKGSNVDCARGRNSVSFLPSGPGVGNPDPCTDNQFHGTHVAGTVAAQANGIGVVGVAPNVTLVPVKVCDASGYCYVSAVVDGLTYAGDIRLDVINMSFFVDDNAFQESTEFKCNSDPTQRAFRESVERAIAYAISRGVVPVAALGNSDEDLGNPVGGERRPTATSSRRRRRASSASPRSAPRARRRATRTTASRPTTSPRRAATARPATARRRSSRRSRQARTAASRGPRWPRRTRPASRL